MRNNNKSKKHKIKGGTRKKRNHKNPQIYKMNCNPNVSGKTVNGDTCYTKDVLLKIRDEYNKKHTGSNKIKTNEPNKIWYELKEKLVFCDKEDCWLKELNDDILKGNITEYIFAPYSPPEWEDNPNEWLSNIDILNVLQQYEKKYKNFKFLGPSPINFDEKQNSKNYCIEEYVCRLSLREQINNGINKIAIVFNLDRHDQPGSHWVSLFIDLECKYIFYFDSAGNKIPREIEILKDRLIKEVLNTNTKLHYYDNENIDHQKGGSECGMYSLFFIITMLTGETKFDKNMNTNMKINLFQKKRIPDKYVEQYRNIYFNI